MVIVIFVGLLAPSVIFMVFAEAALLRDCRVPKLMYVLQFRDLLMDSEIDDQQEKPCRTLPLSA